MKLSGALPPLLLVPLLALAPSCTVLRVHSAAPPPRVESHGLIDGHLALGMSEEAQLVRLTLFEGRSPGSFLEFSLWKLFRLELGVAGASVGLGPLHVGLGILFYDPEIPIEYPESADARDDRGAEPEHRHPRVEVDDGGE